ncbi:glutamate receptor 2.8-like protein [Tanacetum coccineum]
MRMLVKDTRSQDGKDDKDNDKGSKSRSQSMKEQAYNKEQRERPRPHELNDKSNLIDLIKELITGSYIEHKVEEVKFHLFKNRIDLSYTKWSKHEEKDEPSISAPKPVNATTEFVDDMNFASDIPTDGPTIVEMDNATKDHFDEDDLRITDGVLLHLSDLQAWRSIDEKFPEIAEDPRNLWLGISADGVDVNT